MKSSLKYLNFAYKLTAIVFAITLIIGLIMVVIFITCIRKQLFITEKQYISGMIPHHSMAILTSEEIVKKSNNREVSELAKSWFLNYLK